MIDLSPIEVEATKEHQWTIVWLHGLGADGHDFVPVAKAMGLESVRYVFPNAPIAPVTLNHGMKMRSWYDIKSLEVVPDRESYEDVLRSAEALQQLIATEGERLGGTDRIFLAGFSQGGAMTYHHGLRTKEPLAGLICWSTYIVAPERLETEISAIGKTLPLFAAHGSYDPVVKYARGQDSYELVKKLSPDRSMQFETYPMQHEVCLEEVKALKTWLTDAGVR